MKHTHLGSTSVVKVYARMSAMVALFAAWRRRCAFARRVETNIATNGSMLSSTAARTRLHQRM